MAIGGTGRGAGPPAPAGRATAGARRSVGRPPMLTALRAAWARQDFAPLRAALSAPWELSPAAARRPAAGEPRAGLLRIEGPVAANPMSGALFRAGRRLPPAPVGGEPRPTDWIVQSFPSRLRYPAIAPLWYGAAPTLAAILDEALPRALMLDRLSETAGAVALVSRELGRLDRMQELLNAGVFAPRAVKVHAWDKLISAPLAWRLAEAPGPAEREAALARVRAAFPGRAGAARPVLLHGPAAEASLAALAARAGALALDPDATPLSRLLPALAAAPRVLATPGAFPVARLALAGVPLAVLAEGAGRGRERVAGEIGEIPAPTLMGDAASAWLAQGDAPASR